jgi:IS30 family transposase
MIDEATWQFAQDRLLEQWSPEQISGHAAISPETVYQRIYKQASWRIAVEESAQPEVKKEALRQGGTAWHDTPGPNPSSRVACRSKTPGSKH